MAIPLSVVQKVHVGMALTEREKDMMILIPETGFNVLSKIPRLEPVAKIMHYQNKNFDGSGFPKELADTTRIPMGSRLLKILSGPVDLKSKGEGRRRAIELMRQNRRSYDMAIFEPAMSALRP
ncbi:MAG: hypothetical protein HY735_00560 [Verrucomicrobia bacterium]|nr:hypothetical protein [Verrucomicrobiota bacterium]